MKLSLYSQMLEFECKKIVGDFVGTINGIREYSGDVGGHRKERACVDFVIDFIG